MSNYNCPFCHKGFSSLYALKQHISKELARDIKWWAYQQKYERFKAPVFLDKIKNELQAAVNRYNKIIKCIEELGE